MTDHILLLQLGALLLGIGALAGFLSGLIGVGGGIIFVPALYFTLSSLGISPDHAMHVAIGTSFAVIFLTVGTSTLKHHKKGGVDLHIAKGWGLFLVFGVIAGSFLASHISGEVLRRIFSIVVVVMAAYMALGHEKPEAKRPAFLTDPVLRGITFLIGVVAALTGVGGAVLTVPLMICAGLSMTRAVGTGAALGMIASLPGMASYVVMGWSHIAELPAFSFGYVNLAAMGLLASASMPVVPFGVKLSHKLDRQLLRRIFSGVLVIVALRMMLS